MPPAGLACFDFDWSLIDTDSDRFVIEHLSPALRQKLDSSRMQWTDLQNECLQDFHQQGGSGQVIRDALTLVPLDPHMVQVCQLLHDNGWVLAIVSDANTVYIEGILQHYGIRHLFSTIITNPAFWDAHDRLHIQRLIPADAPPHGCPTEVCSLNICKGQEVDKLLTSLDARVAAEAAEAAEAGAEEGSIRMMYVGDGRNDYCPALRMRNPTDMYFVRRGRSLEKYLTSGDPSLQGSLKAMVMLWEQAGDILNELQSRPQFVKLGKGREEPM